MEKLVIVSNAWRENEAAAESCILYEIMWKETNYWEYESMINDCWKLRKTFLNLLSNFKLRTIHQFSPINLYFLKIVLFMVPQLWLRQITLIDCLHLYLFN